MYCIKCEKNNITVDIDNHEYNCDYDKIRDCYIEGQNFAESISGIILIDTVGYGSVHDGDVISIGICDNCLDESIKKGTALFLSTHNDTDTGKNSPSEKSKSAFKRRSNLDDLLDS